MVLTLKQLNLVCVVFNVDIFNGLVILAFSNLNNYNGAVFLAFSNLNKYYGAVFLTFISAFLTLRL